MAPIIMEPPGDAIEQSGALSADLLLELIRRFYYAAYKTLS